MNSKIYLKLTLLTLVLLSQVVYIHESWYLDKQKSELKEACECTIKGDFNCAQDHLNEAAKIGKDFWF